MNKIILSFFAFLIMQNIFSQTVSINTAAGSSGNVIIGLSSYNVTEAIYLESEIGAANYTSTAITHIDFNCYTLGTGINSISGSNFNIYLKDVPLTTTTLATGAYSTTGYTLVYSGPYNYLATGWNGVNLTTPYTRTAGNNLQLLTVRTDNVANASNSFSCSNGNAVAGTAALTCRRYNSTVAPVSGTSSLTQSAFRPSIQFYAPVPIDASISSITTPNLTCFSTPQTYTVQLKNLGTSNIAIGAASVTLKVRGANTYTATMSNTTLLANNATENIVFTGANISLPGTNYDTAYITTLTGDASTLNDTLKRTNSTMSTISSFPALEDAETTLPIFGWVAAVSGASNYWGIQSTAYTNALQTAALNAHGGSKFYIFSSYNAVAGTISRLFSNCITLPTGTCPKSMSFWMSHDNTSGTPELDSMYVSVSTDKGVTWTRINIDGVAGLQRTDATLVSNAAPIWRQSTVDLSAYAGQTIEIGFEGVSKYGNSFGLDDITIQSSATTNVALSTVGTQTLTASCDDNGWTYYQDATNKNVLAVLWGTNTASKAAAVATVTLDAANFMASSGSGATAKSTHTMKRYWNINVAGNQPTTPVSLRFFYDPAEKTATDNDATTFNTANAGSTLESGTWFKSVGYNFVANSTNISDWGVNNAIALTDVNAAAGAKINNVLYAQFDGITSFSGGTYASGVGPSTPLPLTINYINGYKQNNNNLITWKVSCTNASNITLSLERSGDGTNFSTINTIQTNSLRCQQPFDYTDFQLLSGVNYYRVKIIDANGKVTYSKIVALLNKAKGFDIISLMPNLVNEISTLSIASATNEKVKIIVTNSVGAQVITNEFSLNAGSNLINMNFAKLSAGVYYLQGIAADGISKTIRFVKE